MTFKVFLTVFLTVFIAELGDKTQIATLLFAAEGRASRALVFLAALLALAVSTALAVLAGGVLARYLDPRHVELLGGVVFVTIGVWMMLRGGRLVEG